MDTRNHYGPECEDEWCDHETCLLAYIARTRNEDTRLGLHPCIDSVPERIA